MDRINYLSNILMAVVEKCRESGQLQQPDSRSWMPERGRVRLVTFPIRPMPTESPGSFYVPHMRLGELRYNRFKKERGPGYLLSRLLWAWDQYHLLSHGHRSRIRHHQKRYIETQKAWWHFLTHCKIQSLFKKCAWFRCVQAVPLSDSLLWLEPYTRLESVSKML